MHRRLLMASHVNRQPCDFHPPHPGAGNRRGFRRASPLLAPSQGSWQQRGLLWESSRCSVLVFPAGGRSSESAELKTSAPDVSASLLTVRCCSSLVQLVKPCAGHLGCRAKPSTLRTAVKTWCSTAAQWDFWELKGGWAARWIDLK